MPRFHRRSTALAAALSLALALPFIGWIGGLGDLWQRVVVAVTASSESSESAIVPEPEPLLEPEPQSSNPDDGDDKGAFDPDG